MGGGEPVHHVFVVHEHVADARQRKSRQREILPRHAIRRCAITEGPQQERKHEAEGKRYEQQRLLVGRVGGEPSIDVEGGHCDRHHAHHQRCVPGKLPHRRVLYYLMSLASR